MAPDPSAAADPNAHAPDHVGPFDPADPVKEAEEVAYNALCKCDDTYGDNPFCPVCVYEEQWP